MRTRRGFSSNTFRLNFNELAVTAGILVIGTLFLLPFLWNKVEKIEAGREFRISYESRDDYWVYRKWAEKAAQEYPVMFLGDSVVWGMYVDNGNTLPAKLNARLNRQVVANLAIDGLHSVALEGLLEYYGAAIRNKTVILHFNPLWLNSRKYDLSDEEEMQVQHPRLIPQFSSKYKCYTESLPGRMNIFKERVVPFYSLLNHIRLAFFDNEDLNQWMIDHPFLNPLGQLSLNVSPAEKEKRNSRASWKEHGIAPQAWAWVPLDQSYQWQAFTRIVKLLKERDNKICVMVGPINPYMMTPTSLAGFRKAQQNICAWLQSHQAEYVLVPDLPSDTYADASHPLDKGYDLIADTLLHSPVFEPYLKRGSPLCSVKE